MDFVKRLPQNSEPDFIRKQASVGAAGRAVDALVGHMAIPRAAQMGLLGAGAGGVGGFISGGEGNRMSSAMTGALMGGAAGAGGGYMLGRRQAVQMLPEMSGALAKKVDDFAAPTLSSLRRGATQLAPAEQEALRASIKSRIAQGGGDMMPAVEDAFSLSGLGALAGGGAIGASYGSSQRRNNPHGGRRYGYGPPPPPRFGYGRY